MLISLVGADLEENLGLGMIAASLKAAGHQVEVLPFNEAQEAAAVVRRLLGSRPRLVGLGIQFQHRAHEFLSLAGWLRAEGYRGHITSGGHFSTMAYRQVLSCYSAVDSVALHEAEGSMVELASALQAGLDPSQVPGLALRNRDGVPERTAARAQTEDLDSLPFALRYREPTLHLGIPFIPMWGGRGCWGSCAFCSINTFYCDARAQSGGKKFRQRSCESIAAEIAGLWRRAGGPSIFCFHDDTFLLPRPQDSLARIRQIRDALDQLGIGKVGFIGKSRPECLTEGLCRELKALGVIRLYIGIENASQNGQDHLHRKTRTAQLSAAMAAMNRAGIFGCYNLLIFEPDSVLDDIKDNIAFMREHAGNPVNFCRAEAYHGTPLQLALQERGLLGGSYLGWDYRIQDDRTELLFRICSAAFRERNFHPRGVANRYMGLGYLAQVIERFYDGDSPAGRELRRRAREITREVSLETADLLERALEMAATADLSDRDAVERHAARLGMQVAARDGVWHSVFNDLLSDMRAFTRNTPDATAPRRVPRRLYGAVQGLALAGCIATAAPGCAESRERGTYLDDGGAGYGGDQQAGAGGGQQADSGGGQQAGAGGGQQAGSGAGVAGWYDPVPPDAGWYDPLPFDAGIYDGSRDAAPDAPPVDPLPWDAGWYDPLPVDAGWYDPVPADDGRASLSLPIDSDTRKKLYADTDEGRAQVALVDHWRNTSPKRASRTRDLPLCEPPEVVLAGRVDGDRVEVILKGGPLSMTIRWECLGEIEGSDRRVSWRPHSEDDQLRAAVRTAGGVAVITLRAADIGYKSARV